MPQSISYLSISAQLWDPEWKRESSHCVTARSHATCVIHRSFQVCKAKMFQKVLRKAVTHWQPWTRDDWMRQVSRALWNEFNMPIQPFAWPLKCALWFLCPAISVDALSKSDTCPLGPPATKRGRAVNICESEPHQSFSHHPFNERTLLKNGLLTTWRSSTCMPLTGTEQLPVSFDSIRWICRPPCFHGSEHAIWNYVSQMLFSPCPNA